MYKCLIFISRLLSEKGIPTLRRRARDLRLKGKGHEVSPFVCAISFSVKLVLTNT